VFRTGTSAVLLDIVVRDRRGRPIRDLRQDEITVLEDGAHVQAGFDRYRAAGLKAGCGRDVGVMDFETHTVPEPVHIKQAELGAFPMPFGGATVVGSLG
jgi:hypothetical protein